MLVCCSVLQTIREPRLQYTHAVSVLYSLALSCALMHCAAQTREPNLELTDVSVVQCGAMWCSGVQCGALWCIVLQCGAVWCSVVQCGAVWCSVVQCVAVEESHLKYTDAYSVLQCVAVCL